MDLTGLTQEGAHTFNVQFTPSPRILCGLDEIAHYLQIG